MIKSVNHQERYVVLDVETTGLSPWRGDRVIEIGAVAIEGGDMIAEFNTLVQTPRAIPFQATQINGITDEMLIGQPTPQEAFPALEAFLQDSIIIAHNARFDLGFLRREYELLGTKFHRPHVCTLEMSRNRFLHLRNHKLETVYRHLIGEEGHDRFSAGNPDRVPRMRQQTHRALDDARMVAEIWLVMEEK
jgi:DNA polymerase-3 subunit epsilon